MLRKTGSYHSLVILGLVLVVGVLSVGGSWWLALQTVPVAGPAHALIDLATVRWYARQGFSDNDRGGFDPAQSGVRAVDHLPIHLNEVFGIPPGTGVHSFTLETSFTLPPESGMQALGLDLAELGDNWAIYFNGIEIRREIFLGTSGQIVVHRLLDRVLILLPPAALHTGSNTLVIWFAGEAPATPFFPGWAPGLTLSQGYVIAPAGPLLLERSIWDAISWFQIGVYFFVGLNYLLIYWRQRERYALYFCLSLFACVAYSFALSSLAVDVVLDSAIIGRVMYVSNICLPGLMGLTLWTYFYPRRPPSMALRVLVGLAAAGCLAVWLAPLAWVDPVFNVYLFVILGSVLYLIRLVARAMREGVPDARKILVTGPVILLLVLWAILDQLVFRTGVDLTGWIPFLLAVVFALVFVDQFWRLQKGQVETNRQLALSRDHLEEQVQTRSAELRAANTELSTTNQRLIDTGAQAQAALEEVRRLNADLEGRVQERTSELRLAKEAAEAASRAKTAFLAIMGHELRTPLNSIFLAAEMLRDHDASQAANRDLPDTILASGRRLLRMVEGVLEYATADAPPNAAPLNVEAALQDVATRFETRAAQKGVTLTFHTSPGVPSVGFDQHQFDQVLRRLVENALKYTPEGGRVTVAADPVACWAFPQGERPALRMTVADTGAGLRDEDCERVFEPFVQLEASYLQHSEGVGLGLTLARRHVELYGGYLWAKSGGPGKGSTFTVLIPAQRDLANLTAASCDSTATSAKL